MCTERSPDPAARGDALGRKGKHSQYFLEQPGLLLQRVAAERAETELKTQQEALSTENTAAQIGRAHV